MNLRTLSRASAGTTAAEATGPTTAPQLLVDCTVCGRMHLWQGLAAELAHYGHATPCAKAVTR